MSNADLASFFTTGKDPSTNRPFNLLRTYGNHGYILAVLAASDADHFIETAIDETDLAFINDLLSAYEAFNTIDYLNAISTYFGKATAERVFNALFSDFVYTRQFVAKEFNLYGSSRLGVKKDTCQLLYQKFKGVAIDSAGHFDLEDALVINQRLAQIDTVKVSRILAFKNFELSNHLGNVLATILDRRTLFDTVITSTDTIAIWDADIVGAQDYYPFGMLLPDRVYSADSTGSGDYRYGFNGKEHDPEWNGNGNMYDYGFRIYDPRIAKFLSVDPLTASFPFYTPYQFAANTPISAIDLDGLEAVIIVSSPSTSAAISAYAEGADQETAKKLMISAAINACGIPFTADGADWASRKTNTNLEEGDMAATTYNYSESEGGLPGLQIYAVDANGDLQLLLYDPNYGVEDIIDDETPSLNETLEKRIRSVEYFPQNGKTREASEFENQLYRNVKEKDNWITGLMEFFAGFYGGSGGIDNTFIIKPCSTCGDYVPSTEEKEHKPELPPMLEEGTGNELEIIHFEQDYDPYRIGNNLFIETEYSINTTGDTVLIRQENPDGTYDTLYNKTK